MTLRPEHIFHSRITGTIPFSLESMRRWLFRALSTACLLILLFTQVVGSLPVMAAASFPGSKPPALKASLTYQQFVQLAQQSAHQRQQARWFKPAVSVPLTKQELTSLAAQHPFPPSTQPPTMQPIRQTLSPAFLAGTAGTPPLDLTSSDHRLEVQLPAGTFDLFHATVAGAATGTNQPGTQATPTPGTPPTASPSPSSTAKALLESGEMRYRLNLIPVKFGLKVPLEVIDTLKKYLSDMHRVLGGR